MGRFSGLDQNKRSSGSDGMYVGGGITVNRRYCARYWWEEEQIFE